MTKEGGAPACATASERFAAPMRHCPTPHRGSFRQPFRSARPRTALELETTGAFRNGNRATTVAPPGRFARRQREPAGVREMFRFPQFLVGALLVALSTIPLAAESSVTLGVEKQLTRAQALKAVDNVQLEARVAGIE